MRIKFALLLLVPVLVIGCASTSGKENETYVPYPQEKFHPIELGNQQSTNIITDTYITGPIISEKPVIKQVDSKPIVEVKSKEPKLVVPVVSKSAAQKYARSRVGDTQYSCLYQLWMRESGWRWNATNKSSGAYGIPQALPGNKMKSAGDDWRTNPITQVKWGIRYVNGRYGSACGAWRHFQQVGWY